MMHGANYCIVDTPDEWQLYTVATNPQRES